MNVEAVSDRSRVLARRRVLRIVAQAALVTTVRPGWGQAPLDRGPRLDSLLPGWARTDSIFTAEVATAIGEGLRFLAGTQQPDGKFPGRMGSNVAVVSLAGLAFLAAGNLPGRGPQGIALQRAVDYVADACSETGFIIRREAVSRGAMYGHGFASLFLAEVLGLTARHDLATKVRAAVEVILAAQHRSGGWRYTPQPLEADLSVTICQMMALRAARNAGVQVPAATVDAAIDYIRRCQNPDGGFMYQLGGGESRFPLTAGAIVALQNAGRYEGKELEPAYAFLQRRFPDNLSPRRNNYFFYAHYYSVQALWQRNDESFSRWYAALREVLLPGQQADGGWSDFIGRSYATAMACLVLSAPRTTLPIFQR
jgi:hypothetical protein